MPNSLLMFFPIIILFVLMYFMLIRPQKKQEKKLKEMRNSMQVGDEVVTAGGIIGRIVNVKDDTIVIETGSDRSKVRIKRWAISEVIPMETEIAE